jgi:hypothetical protein
MSLPYLGSSKRSIFPCRKYMNHLFTIIKCYASILYVDFNFDVMNFDFEPFKDKEINNLLVCHK